MRNTFFIILFAFFFMFCNNNIENKEDQSEAVNYKHYYFPFHEIDSIRIYKYIQNISYENSNSSAHYYTILGKIKENKFYLVNVKDDFSAIDSSVIQWDSIGYKLLEFHYKDDEKYKQTEIAGNKYLFKNKEWGDSTRISYITNIDENQKVQTDVVSFFKGFYNPNPKENPIPTELVILEIEMSKTVDKNDSYPFLVTSESSNFYKSGTGLVRIHIESVEIIYEIELIKVYNSVSEVLKDNFTEKDSM